MKNKNQSFNRSEVSYVPNRCPVNKNHIEKMGCCVTGNCNHCSIFKEGDCKGCSKNEIHPMYKSNNDNDNETLIESIKLYIKESIDNMVDIESIEKLLVKHVEKRFPFEYNIKLDKLKEENQELLIELYKYKRASKREQDEIKTKIISEMGDNLTVIIHFAHFFGFNLTDIIYGVFEKLLIREVDPTYLKSEK